MSDAGNGVVDAIVRANAGRREDVLALKYAAMRADAFSFYRGTAHLFAADFFERAPPELRDAPPTWLCGDAHLENVGTYRAASDLVVFDVNDFDETWLGPALYDPARLIASSIVWRASAGAGDAAPSIDALVDGYAAGLAAGKALWVDRDTASGAIGALLQQVYERKYGDILAKRTTGSGDKRRIALGKHALAVDETQRRRAESALQAFAAGLPHPERFRVLDVAWRIAGTGSLGLERYAVLVAGDGGDDGVRFIDVKLAAPSTLAGHVATPQPAWRNEAERVVGGYRRLQCRTPRHLGAVAVDARPFVVRTLQPVEDRVDLATLSTSEVDAMHRTFGALFAWAQLRSGGRDGSSIADRLMAFGADDAWRAPLVAYATGAAGRMQDAWKAFRASGLGSP